jgi:hypothetical protein
MCILYVLEGMMYFESNCGTYLWFLNVLYEVAGSMILL